MPAVARLKQRFPGARLRWLVNPEWAPLLEGNPTVDDVLVFPRNSFRGLFGWTKIPAWIRNVREERSDLVLDFQGLLRSALIGRCIRANHGRMIGLSDAREGSRMFYDEYVDVRGRRHAVDRYLAITERVIGNSARAPLDWPLPAGAPPTIAIPERFILLHPFSRGEGKSLTPDDVVQFCHALQPLPVVLVGRTELSVPPIPGVVDLLNQTGLRELIWIIRKADFVVSVDSGPMHIAAAITSKLISIHTWSDPAKVGPYNPDAWVWQAKRLVQQKEFSTGNGVDINGVKELARWILDSK